MPVIHAVGRLDLGPDGAVSGRPTQPLLFAVGHRFGLGAGSALAVDQHAVSQGSIQVHRVGDGPVAHARANLTVALLSQARDLEGDHAPACVGRHPGFQDSAGDAAAAGKPNHQHGQRSRRLLDRGVRVQLPEGDVAVVRRGTGGAPGDQLATEGQQQAGDDPPHGRSEPVAPCVRGREDHVLPMVHRLLIPAEGASSHGRVRRRGEREINDVRRRLGGAPSCRSGYSSSRSSCVRILADRRGVPPVPRRTAG